MQKILGFVLWVGSSFLLSTQLSTLVMSLMSKKCCHVGIHIILGTPCEVVSPNFHAHNGCNCTYRPQVNWDLALGTSCELALRYLNFWDSIFNVFLLVCWSNLDESVWFLWLPLILGPYFGLEGMEPYDWIRLSWVDELVLHKLISKRRWHMRGT